MPAYGAGDFNARLKGLMVGYGTTQAGQQDALSNVQQDIDNVKGIMTENIERVLERGERIDLLVDKTDRLGVGAHDFRMRSRGLKRQMWWKNVKLMVLLGVVVVFLVYLFVGFGCGLPGFFCFFCFWFLFLVLWFFFFFFFWAPISPRGSRKWRGANSFFALGWSHCVGKSKD